MTQWITRTGNLWFLFCATALLTAGFIVCSSIWNLTLPEGVVQVLALTDTGDLTDAKAYITPLKTALFLSGLVIALAAWMKWLIVRIRRA